MSARIGTGISDAEPRSGRPSAWQVRAVAEAGTAPTWAVPERPPTSALDDAPEDAVAGEAAADDEALRHVARRYGGEAAVAQWSSSLEQAGLKTGDHVTLIVGASLGDIGLLFLLVSRGISPLLLASDSPRAERVSNAARLGSPWLLEIDTQGALRLERLAGAVSPAGHADEPSGGVGVEHIGATCQRTSGVCIHLLTSGSTGQPSLVARPLETWRAEAQRYRRLLGLSDRHHVLLAAPMQHAYSLGWIWAAALAGCSLELHSPLHLGALVEALRTRATHCAVTPFVASLLARRQAQAQALAPTSGQETGQGARPSQLQVVMAGAGPVDAILDALFLAAFGLGLSRNYGSTESGALFAGLAPVAPMSIGQPMPGIRIVGEPPAGTPFALDVLLEDGRLHHTGDIAQCDPPDGGHDGQERGSRPSYRLIGRATTAIRRGDRWISSTEIESVIHQFPGVASSRVRALKSAQVGNDHILASVQMQPGARWDAPALRAFCAEQLSRSKLPDYLEQVTQISRAANGKPLPSPVYRRAAPAVWMEAAQAYKRAHLLLALHACGVLDRLDGQQDVDQIATASQLHPDTVTQALQVACLMGLVVEAAAAPDGLNAPSNATVAADAAKSEDAENAATAPPTPQVGLAPSPSTLPATTADSLRDLLNLEQAALTGWNSLEAVCTTLRHGLPTRPFATQPVPEDAVARYQAAMNGEHKRMGRLRAVRRLLRDRSGALRVADLSATTGQYSRHLARLGRYDAAGSCYVPIGGLNGDEGVDASGPAADRSPPAGRKERAERADLGLRLTPSTVERLAQGQAVFDLIVLDNACHDATVSLHLPMLMDRLAPTGVLVVDDLFLAPARADLGLDWLTHGGLCHLTREALDRSLAGLGLQGEAVFALTHPAVYGLSLYTRTSR
ncbi:AMP-binding protein [Roseateles amylovorans]|uniref:AMP-binding protein n=1 Tax=Roseateles amylovorans TaxID=2978473 RepID=A0ABY6AYD3_9BURK|nr:AMP-binding protein [Roseateles amylovorans]UXH76100.1 AMP-binding protein [Roseateles amylovorans]